MTGLQWAVLTAYARTLPKGSEARRFLEGHTAKEKPTAAGQRVALMVAEAGGLLAKGKITPTGKTAARAFLPRLVLLEAKDRALNPPPSIHGPHGGPGGDR